ncbi:MAG: hydantoinase/oxoprolinase family protein [Dongiaceae bacterium]
MSIGIAVDVGGTFTDLVLREAGGPLVSLKAPTTPGRVVDGVLDAVGLAAGRRGCSVAELLARCERFAFGSTTATNAILEGKAPRTALICTEGFRDILLVREGGKDDSYNIRLDYPPPYIPRHLTFPVRERVTSEGEIDRPLDEAEVVDVLRRIAAAGVKAIAVCLLWSIADDRHERRIGALIEQHLPGMPYSLSSRVSPSIREYRRASATAIDASMKPLVSADVAALEGRLRAQGFAGVLTLVTSSGGQTGSSEIVHKPVHLCLSGPSAAPEAGRRLARAEGVAEGNVIVVDMGGTSFDVSIVTGWDIPMHREGIIAGHMFGVPSVDVKTVGAGGGSIARVDAGGFIHVGPESAGAQPGPACYGRGGTRPTVTDANLVRGFLNPERFAGGIMSLQPALAEAAIRDGVAAPLGMSEREAAALICLTVEQNMVGAIEDITLKRGVDPREYIMIAGGAAAGLHAVPMARELGIRRIMVPSVAGALSAYGILVSDIRSGFAVSLLTSSAAFDFARVEAALARLEAEATAYLDRMAVPAGHRALGFSAEARYRGQVWQLTLPLGASRIPDAAALAAVVEDFHRLHEKRYFVRSPDDVIEFTEWNVMAIGHAAAVEPAPAAAPQGPAAGAQAGAAAAGRRPMYFREIGGVAEVPVFRGEALAPGQEIAGPAVIEAPLTTIVLYPASRARATALGNIWIELH